MLMMTFGVQNGESWKATSLDAGGGSNAAKGRNNNGPAPGYGVMEAHGVGGCETAAAPTGTTGGVRAYVRNQNYAPTAWTTFSSDYG